MKYVAAFLILMSIICLLSLVGFFIAPTLFQPHPIENVGKAIFTILVGMVGGVMVMLTYKSFANGKDV